MSARSTANPWHLISIRRLAWTTAKSITEHVCHPQQSIKAHSPPQYQHPTIINRFENKTVVVTGARRGIAGITKAFACEWAKERINVNAVAAGCIATENTRPICEDEKRNESILARIPEGRWGVPEAASFLAS